MDTIGDLHEQRRRTRGRGSHKLWSRPAILRVCFGIGMLFAKSNANHRGRARERAPGANAVAASARTYAEFSQGGHSYITQIRCAVSYWLLQVQLKSLLLLGRDNDAVKHTILTVMLDETEVKLIHDGEAGVHHLLMIHAKMLQRFYSGRTVL